MRFTCLLATTTDDGSGAGNVATGTGIETATGTETAVETRIEAEEIGIETHVEEAAPEALIGVRPINVRVSTIHFHSRSKSSLGTERDRKDYRYDGRRDSDRRDRDDRRRDDRRDERDHHRDEPRGGGAPKNPEFKPSLGLKEAPGKFETPTLSQALTFHKVSPVPEPRIQSEGLENGQEEGESMDAVNEDDEGMAAMMGISGFGSTKVWVSSI